MQKVIITFKDDTPDADYQSAKDKIKDQGGTITNEFEPLFKGFSAEIPDSLTIEEVNSLDSNISSVEEDGVATTQT